mmetsp:Transcript_135808/g.434483  ORF Transcript_135808/g.434483 Transcript_135808/m.434483 type:complete len:334 (-) Transcript_135808:6243-7244(-)
MKCKRGRLRSLAFRQQKFGELRHRRPGQEVTNGKKRATAALAACLCKIWTISQCQQQAESSDRTTSELKEISLIATDCVWQHRQDVCHDRTHCPFADIRRKPVDLGLRTASCPFLARWILAIGEVCGHGQLVALELAIRAQRQHCEGLDVCRHHVLRKARDALAAELRATRCPTLAIEFDLGPLRRVVAISHQHDMSAQVPELHTGSSCYHPNMRAVPVQWTKKCMLHFTELDPKAIQLHLCIFSAANFDEPSTDTAQVASAKQLLSCLRVCYELCPGLLLVVVVAASHADSSDVDDTDGPRRCMQQRGLLKDVHRLVTQRNAIRNRGPSRGH